MTIRHARQRGFTLIEMITVIVITGILSFFALRAFNRNDFDARGYSDQVSSLIRYAQKEAIAKRRTVCVSIGTNAGGMSSVSLKFGAAAGAACDTALPGPTGAASLDAPSAAVILTAKPTAFSFDPLGRPDLAKALSITVNGDTAPYTITVEMETGYVHY